MSNTNTFTLLYFSYFQEKAGVSEQKRHLNSALSTGDLFTTICDELGLDPNEHQGVRVSINHRFATFTDPIHPNDIVAFIPPVAGG